jgi:Tol biopolymer transport system component
VILVLVVALAAASAGSSSSGELSPTGRIAYAPRVYPKDPRIGDNWEIYTVDPGGGRSLNLTRHSCSESDPAWAHDGRRIAFVCNNVLIAVLALAPAESSGTVATGAQTPQGKIVYSQRFWPKDDRLVDNWELFVKTLGRGNTARITRNPRCSDTWPSWSRSGRWIAFACGYGPRAGVYVVDAEGRGRRTIAALPNRRIDGTAWSPDERRIAFVAGGIWVVNADGSGRRRLTSSQDSAPTWSRDGTRIAYEHMGNVFLMRADGTARRRLVARASKPAWSPDGRRILFVRGLDIWVMSADGSERRRLRCCRRHGVATVAWSPDSRHLAYDGGSGLTAGIRVMPIEGSVGRQVAGGEEIEGFSWGPG